jgi:nucleoside-diphosphate-sugar epimerase
MKSSTDHSLRQDLNPLLQDSVKKISDLKNSSVTIIGGGFVGLWMSEALTALNDIYDFKIKIHLQTLTGKNIKSWAPHLLKRSDFNFIQQDGRRSKFSDSTQYIVHAAAPVTPHLQQSQPILAANSIAEGATSCFEAARLLPELKNILYLSSGTVYGTQPFEHERLSENDFQKNDPSVLSNVYSESKRFSEALCVSFRNEARLPVVIARPFALLGPYQLSTTPWALHSFIADALQGRPIRILGDGESVRSYLYGADAAVWLLNLLAAGKNGGVFNIGSPSSLKLIQAAQLVATKFENKVDVQLLAQGAHLKKTRFVPDTNKIQSEFGLLKLTSIEDAISKTVDWMRQNKGVL